MDAANKSKPVQPSGTEPLANAQPSSETDARTFIEKTLSESGNEAAQTSATKSGEVTVGSKLGPYLLVRKLGQGGMGAVYEARHARLKKTFALKVLPPGFASNAAALSRFDREMEAVGKLDHPNIIKATNADEWNGTHYLVMEYIEGTDLSVLVKERGVLSVRDACKTIRQAALGLQHAHEHGLVHRDIKPSNLFLTNSGQVKLLDLGLARLGGDDQENAGLTSSGQMLGTPDYMAPEQWDNTHTVDARADLYSLGCTLGYLLTGKAPFDTGKVRSFLHIMKAHSETSPPDLSTLRNSVPAELNDLFQRLLAKKPEDRFQTAAEVATALEPFTRRADPPRPQHDAPASDRPRDDSPSAVGERGGVSPLVDFDSAQRTGGLTPPRSPEPDFEQPTDSLSATSSFPQAADAEADGPFGNTAPLNLASGAASAPRSVTEPMPRSANPSRRRWLIAAGFLAFAVLFGIIIKITNKDGTVTEIKVPEGAKIEITTSPIKIENSKGWHGWPADAPPPAIAPFDAEQAQHHQEAWAKYLGVPVEYTNSLGMKFRLIPPGEFLMGSTKEEIEETLKVIKAAQLEESIKSEGPQHKVILTQPIYFGVYEVTQGQYEKLMGTNPSGFSAMGAQKDAVAGMDTTTHPVERVGFPDAIDFSSKLSQQEQLKPFYFRAGETVTHLPGNGYRLPTEAEWEFACRAGTTTRFWIGDKNNATEAGWFYDNSGGRTHAVGELKGNPFGLFDVHGNVSEWVQDRWERSYYDEISKKPVIDPNNRQRSADRRLLVVRGLGTLNVDHGYAAFRFASGWPGGNGLRMSLPVDAVRQALKLTGPAMAKRPKASVTDASTSSTAKPLTPLPQLDLDETDPLPKWELPAGSPLPVVAPCSPEDAAARQQKWAEHLKRPVVETLDVAALARTRGEETGAVPRPLGSGPDRQTDRPLPNGRGTVDSPSTLKFALIPPGEFRKIFTRPRDPAIEPDMPVRRFRITKPYAMSTTEVTWDQFRQFVEATGYQTEAETNGLGGRDREFKPDPKINWRTPGWKPAPNEPVTQVTPRDAEAFCAWLTDPSAQASGGRQPPGSSPAPAPETDPKTPVGLRPPLAKTVVYRLPTEAEWLHACRAGSVFKHVVGPEPQDLADYAWTKEFLDPNPQASPLHLVAQKKPNPFGLHDTLGNVWEVVVDSFPPALIPYATTNDPLGFRAPAVIGSAWDHGSAKAFPDYSGPGWSQPHPTQGFRVLKQFDAEPLPGPLDRPLVLRAGQPLSVHALVPRPEKIPGLQSWSLELAGLHNGAVLYSIASNPNGDLIANGNAYGKISLWDRDGNYQRALLGHEGSVSSLEFSRDGRWLASGADDVRVWNVASGALHALIPMPTKEASHRVRFSPDGKQLAVGMDALFQTSFFIVDLATGRTRSPSTEEQRSSGLAWSPDSTQLASATSDKRLRIWDTATLKVLREIEVPRNGAVEWSSDGQWLAHQCLTDQSNEWKVVVRDAKTLEVTKTLVTKTSAAPVAWLPDSHRLAVWAGENSGVFNTETGEQLTKFNPGNSAIALLDEGKQAVFEYRGRLHFYDTSTGQKLREGKERGRSGGVLTTMSNNGSEVFANWYANIFVFDAATGSRKRQFPHPHPYPYGGLSIQPSPDGSLTAITAPAPVLVIADAQTGAKRYDLSHGEGTVSRVAWSPDGKWLATGATDKLVRVWNVATGKIEHELAGHTGTIWSLAWSPDGTRLASAAEDKTVRLWNPLAGKLVATYDQFPEAMIFYQDCPQKLAWLPDSRRLWIALNQNIVPLDVETGTLGPLENFSNGHFVYFLNTSPDGQRLLAREGAGWTFVRGRDAQDRRLLGQHLGQTAQWHPDSRRFLGWEPGYGTVGFDVETNRRLGLLFPWLTGDHWLCLGPTGHYRGSPGVEDQFVYVAMLPDGSQRTYTPAEFAKKFNWKNDPEKAELLGK